MSFGDLLNPWKACTGCGASKSRRSLHSLFVNGAGWLDVCGTCLDEMGGGDAVLEVRTIHQIEARP